MGKGKLNLQDLQLVLLYDANKFFKKLRNEITFLI